MTRRQKCVLVVLGFAAIPAYFASFPFALVAVLKSPAANHPDLRTALLIPYYPAMYYVQDYGHPGADQYGRYCNWCLGQMGIRE
jgi:hypothetical protein